MTTPQVISQGDHYRLSIECHHKGEALTALKRKKVNLAKDVRFKLLPQGGHS